MFKKYLVSLFDMFASSSLYYFFKGRIERNEPKVSVHAPYQIVGAIDECVQVIAIKFLLLFCFNPFCYVSEIAYQGMNAWLMKHICQGAFYPKPTTIFVFCSMKRMKASTWNVNDFISFFPEIVHFIRVKKRSSIYSQKFFIAVS